MSEQQHQSAPGKSVTRGKSLTKGTDAIVKVIAIAAIALAAWYFWPRQSGKPVPAPRSVSFAESPGQTAISGDQRIALTPAQVQGAGLKIETVGERPSSETAGQVATRIVQNNSYKQN